MKRSYQIKAEATPQRLNFTIRRKLMATLQCQELHASITQINLHPSLLTIFGQFQSFCEHILSHPQNCSYSQFQLCLVIRFQIVGFRYMYLPVVQIQEEKARKDIESLITLSKGLSNLKQQVFLDFESKCFQDTYQRIEWLAANWRTKAASCIASSGKIKQIQSKIQKLTERSNKLDSQIQSYFITDQNNAQFGSSKDIKVKKRRQKFLSQFLSNTHQKVRQVLERPKQEISVLKLGGIMLKSMTVVDLFRNVREIRLPNNLIYKISGLQELRQLRHLDLSSNKIEKIQGLDHSASLKELILHTNMIGKVKNIFHLKKLQILSLSFNKLVQIPKKFQRLSSLIECRLINNQINSLPHQLLVGLQKLKILALFGNPCFTSSHPAKSIIDDLAQKRGVLTASLEY